MTDLTNTQIDQMTRANKQHLHFLNMLIKISTLWISQLRRFARKTNFYIVKKQSRRNISLKSWFW